MEKTTWNGKLQISWRLGVVITIVGSVIAGAFWAGSFTDRVEHMDRAVERLSLYSQTMGVKVDSLRERQAADDVGDQAVEKRLEQIERVLVRIENLLRMSVRRSEVQ